MNKLQIQPGILKPLIAISSFIELLCGLLLIIGLFRNPALMLLSFNLVFVALSFSLIKPMWDMKFYFPRMILVVILLFCLPGHDIFSLDWLFQLGNCYP
jgi:putative oxidoreductase